MSYTRHYCYRIDFEDGFVYFGSRTCRCAIADDSYMGSPKTHAAKWLSDSRRDKTVVSVHATRRLANKAEAKLIRDFWAMNKPLSLNAAIPGLDWYCLGDDHPAKQLKFKLALSERNRGDSNPAKKLKNRLVASARMSSELNPMKRSENRLAMSRRVREPEMQIALAKRNKVQAVCPHCGKNGQRTNMLRWHFDNCRIKLSEADNDAD